VYTNTPASVLGLLNTVYGDPALNITPVGAASPTVTGVTPALPSTGSYLYLVYDYRVPTKPTRICDFGGVKPLLTGCCCTTPLPSAYLDGPDFASATGVYADANLTTQYIDQWFSDGLVFRQQVSGLLGVASTCALCTTDCGSDPISGTGLKKGKYTASYDLGATTGAVIVKYTPNLVPNGIRATYDGTNYNKLTSPVYGKLQSTVPSNNFTVCGDVASQCTGLISTNSFLEYAYNLSSVAWDYLNSSESIAIAVGDLELQALSSGQCIMVIPKIAAGPTTLAIDILATCGPTDFALDVDCPVTIAATTTTIAGWGSSLAACGETQATSHYIVHADGTTGGAPTLHAYVFTDVNGATEAVDGWIAHVGGSYEIFSGIIITVTIC
jgi:hypothetical protein